MNSKFKQTAKRLISGLVAAATAITMLPHIPAFAETGTTTYSYDGYDVDYSVLNEWDNGQTVEIKVTNTGDDSILNWAFKYDAKGEINNLWNATVHDHQGEDYIVKNSDWNYEIAPGQSVNFGYTLVSDEFTTPDNFSLCSKRIEKTSGYEVDLNIVDQWNTGIKAELVITNTFDKPIEAWTFSFNSNFIIDNLWDARILDSTDGNYTVASEMWTNPIAVGESKVIGFTASINEDITPEISNCVLTDVKIDDGNDDSEPDRGDESNGFQDIGDIYFKEPSIDDVIFDEETGIQYIRNQLLVSALPGADKSIFEEIAYEVGADIVGYIELTNDYQFEFTENKTIEDLSTIADYLNSYSFVSNVTLNFYENAESAMTETKDKLYADERTCYTHKKMYDVDGDGVGDIDGTDFDLKKKDTWDESNPRGDNWGLEALRVPSAWDRRDEFNSVRVGVYDGGFDKHHEDMRYAAIANNTTDPYKQDHGTHVAGTIAALHDNDKGISGVATNVELYCYAASGSDVGSAMGSKVAYATLVGSHVKVINVSLQWASKEMVYAASQNIDTTSRDKAREHIRSYADALAEYLNKLVVAGYDFVICVAAGNYDSYKFIVDSSEPYGFREATDDEIKDTSITKVGGNVLAEFGYNLTAIRDENLKRRIIVVGAVENLGHDTYTKALFSNYGDRIDFMAPGVDILSCVPTKVDPTGYALMSGTSMATPHITGLVAMMYQLNPSMSGGNVKSCLMYNARTIFTIDGIDYLMPDATECLDVASRVTSLGGTDVNFPSGIVCGYTKDVDDNTVAYVKITAVRKSTGEYNLSRYSFDITSDSEGHYIQPLPQGIYDFIVYADGYIPYSIRDIKINPDETMYMETVVLSKWPSSGYSTAVQGTVIDAISGLAIKDAVVKLRKGWNNTFGKYCTNIFGFAKSDKTDANGRFSINMSAGSYTAEIIKEGYITGYYNVFSGIVGVIDVPEQETMVLVPVLDSDEYRIVLTWGATPRDLDSHLTYYVGDTQEGHVYYSNRSCTIGDIEAAVLDLDDTSSYGPETITLKLDSSYFEDGGWFSYSVQDYSNRNSSRSSVMSLSNTTVHVYAGNMLIKTIYIPKNRVGTVWHVFDIVGDGIDGIKIKGDFYNCSNPSNVR